MTIEAERPRAENHRVTKPATKTAAKKIAAKKTTVRTKAVRPLGAVVTIRQPVTPKAAQKAPAKRATAKKAPAKNVRVAATQATPIPAPAVNLAGTPAKSKRPLIALVRRTDSRPVSYGERLAALMHKKLDHVGPICHRCVTNASQLASVRAAGPVVAV